MGVFLRGSKIWICFKNEQGRWVNKTTGLSNTPTNHKSAQKILEKIEETVKAGKAMGATVGPLTVKTYAEEWLKERERRQLLVRDIRSHLKNHVYSRMGNLLLTEVRPRHMLQLVRELQQVKVKGPRSKGLLAPRTVRQIYGELRTMFNDALVHDLIQATPCVLKRGHLPPDVDKDPAWREGAIFTRDEIITLISDPRISQHRRVIWAMLALAGPRASECVVRRWSDLDLDAEPLGKLAVTSKYRKDYGREVSGTKTGQARYIPVHPTLAAILREWKLSGWFEFVQRFPQPHDYIVPTPWGKLHKPASLWLALQRDLKTLGMRPRRLHDLRAAVISIARADGAKPDIIKWISHGPSKRSIVDVYTRLPWEVLCAEVSKIDIKLLKSGSLHSLQSHSKQA